MHQDYTLRSPVTVSDFESYFDLRWRVLRAPWNQPRGTEQDDLESAAYHAAVFDRSNQVLAAGRLQLNNPSEAQVRFMAVDPEYQGKGLGKAVLEMLEAEARRQGASHVILQARKNALEFYKACGYHIVEKTFLLYDSIQHYLMKKDIMINSD